MSTDRKRLNSAIQRIAREDPEIRKLLDDFRNSGGKPSEGATTGSGAEDRQICCDGGTSGITNPGSDTRDTGDGGKDGADLGDDPANLDGMGGGSLTGVTDCATGQPICFEGSDWIPPDGWGSPTDPPIPEDYEEGVYWELARSGEPAFPSSLPDTAASQHMDYKGYSCTWYNRVYDPAYYQYFFDCRVDGIGTAGNFLVYRRECDQDAPVGSGCGEPPPSGMWPQDGCVNLATKGGKLVGSKYDPENDGSYSKPMAEIELCDSIGNAIKLAPSGSSSGGWKTIDAINPGDGYLYNKKGEQIARISGDEYSDPSI